jgi:enterochelin esterase family protein
MRLAFFLARGIRLGFAAALILPRSPVAPVGGGRSEPFTPIVPKPTSGRFVGMAISPHFCMKTTSTALRLAFTFAGLGLTFLVPAVPRAQQIPTRLPTDPGTPALIPAGPDAEALAQAAAAQKPSPATVAPATQPVSGATATASATAAGPTQPLQGAPGANPPLHAEGNFLIGPTYARAPELAAVAGVPSGKVVTFTMNSADSKIYPGIAKDMPNPPDLTNVATHPQPYSRTVTVYVPANYVAGTPAPLIVSLDGTGYLMNHYVLDNLIAQHRIPPVVAVMIANGGGDAQGSQRGLEYDTMSGLFAEWIESEVMPLVEKNAGVKITKDPEGRMAMGGSSGAAAAFTMAWFHPELYHRIVSYSGTFVNQQYPLIAAYPHGAWEYHEHLIPQSDPKPIRIWMEVGDRDLLNPNSLRDGMHDWVAANNAMATVLKAKGYHYQYAFALNAGHVDGAVRNQTLPEALEWVWQGYAPEKAEKPKQ